MEYLALNIECLVNMVAKICIGGHERVLRWCDRRHEIRQREEQRQYPFPPY